ncbi:hypothetical protein PHET_02703 [Paragonimus heterotremus]|uniref:Uncharacterized protein n=1 Tax=Paragonimus heterotremus TaxID=100268 RepID=A0A8J4WIH1_9TREM|nr:hypothetical protein PHET_02703 [Paragonimus heterotremus]
MGVQRVYSKIARKHYKCVVEAISKKHWVDALVHIEQCLRLVTTNNRWYVERAEINLKLNRFHSAIADFLYVLSQPVHSYATRRSVCFPTVSTDPEEAVSSSQEKRSDTLRLIHSYIQYGRYLLKLKQFSQAEAQFVQARFWIDQYCCEKTDSPAQTSFLSTELTAASPGEMLTLQDILRLYEAQNRVEDYMNLLTKSIRQSKPSITRRIREVLHKTHEDHPEIEILSSIDLYVARAKLFLSQGMGNLQRARSDAQAVINMAPDHPAAAHLMDYLNRLSLRERDTAMTLTLKSRFSEALVHLHRAVAAQPDMGVLRLERGTLYRRQQKYEESLKDLLEGMRMIQQEIKLDKLSPDSADKIGCMATEQIFLTVVDYAKFLLRNSQFKQAFSIVQNLLQLFPMVYTFYILRGDCNQMMNYFEEAVQDYETAQAILTGAATGNLLVQNETELINCMNERLCESMFPLSLSKLLEGKSDEALNLLNHSIERAPLLPENYAARAYVQYQLRKFQLSWDDVLCCVYLTLSEWVLNHRTDNMWKHLSGSAREVIVSRLVTKTEQMLGPLITKLVRNPLGLKALADGEICKRTANQMLHQNLAKFEILNTTITNLVSKERAYLPLVGDQNRQTLIATSLPDFKLLKDTMTRKNRPTAGRMIFEKKILQTALDNARSVWSCTRAFRV